MVEEEREINDNEEEKKRKQKMSGEVPEVDVGHGLCYLEV